MQWWKACRFGCNFHVQASGFKELSNWPFTYFISAFNIRYIYLFFYLSSSCEGYSPHRHDSAACGRNPACPDTFGKQRKHNQQRTTGALGLSAHQGTSWPEYVKIDDKVLSENWINTYQHSHDYSHLTKQLAC